MSTPHLCLPELAQIWTQAQATRRAGLQPLGCLARLTVTLPVVPGTGSAWHTRRLTGAQGEVSAARCSHRVARSEARLDAGARAPCGGFGWRQPPPGLHRLTGSGGVRGGEGRDHTLSLYRIWVRING